MHLKVIKMKQKSYIKQFLAFLWAWFAIVIIIDTWRRFYIHQYTLLVLIISAFGYIVGLAYLLNWLRSKKDHS